MACTFVRGEPSLLYCPSTEMVHLQHIFVGENLGLTQLIFLKIAILQGADNLAILQGAENLVQFSKSLKKKKFE